MTDSNPASPQNDPKPADLQRVEASVQASEKWYKALIETTGTGYVIIDLKGIVLDANAEYVRLSGHRNIGDILGRSVVEWTAPYERDKNRNAVESCIDKGVIRNFEVDYCTPDDKIIPIELNATMVETGGEKRILALCRDITHRKNAERKIKESEKRFRKVFEESPYGMVLSDAQHRIIKANAAFCSLLGYREADLVSRVFKDFVHPDEAGQVVKNVALWDHGRFTVNKTETRYVKKNGDTIWTAVTLSQIRDADETFRNNLAMVEDITERKKAELDLKSSEEMFRRLIEGAPEAIFVQTDGRLSFVNAAACALFGAGSPDMLLGTDLFERIHPDFHELIRARVNLVNEERKENPLLEETYLRLDGSPVPVEVSAVPIEFHGKNGALVFVRDITERKKTEETLRNAQKLESIGVLAGGIAHDFNNLLSGMFGNLDLARLFIEEGDSKEALETLSRAMGVFDRSRALTRQLLTFSKGGTPERRSMALEQLLQHSVKFALSGSNVQCEFAIAPDLWSCNIDENQIGQVIDNIVINAQQAMPDGGTVTVRAENTTIENGSHAILRDGAYVKITISDTGIGIPKEMLRRIFDPFFSTKQKGSGLGLATTYSIVKRHEGAIEVDSEPGKGSTFTVYLPATREQTDLTPTETSREFRGTGCILIMDDERYILDVASPIIQKMGFSTVTALSGDEALNIVREMTRTGQTVRAAILDLTIPGGRGGKDTVRELLALDPSIKAIVSSGYSDDPIMAKPHEYGFSACLTKPYNIKQIRKVLSEVLGY